MNINSNYNYHNLERHCIYIYELQFMSYILRCNIVSKSAKPSIAPDLSKR